MKYSKEELIELSKNKIRELENGIDELEIEIEDAQDIVDSLVNDLSYRQLRLQKLENWLDEVKDKEEVDIEDPFRPTQQKTLIELGLENKIKEQAKQSIEIFDLLFED